MYRESRCSDLLERSVVSWKAAHLDAFGRGLTRQSPSRRHLQTKKHKTWEADGTIIVEGTKITLFDTEGKRYVA
jgi:hypothetical protein